MSAKGQISHRIYQGERGLNELVRTLPRSDLREAVVDYVGFREEGGRPVERREVAGSIVPLVISFGAPFHIAYGIDRMGADFGSFTARLHPGPALVSSSGSAYCLQVNFTPLGAYRFFQMPQSELSARVVSFEDLLGASASRLADELYHAKNWQARFARVDGIVAERIEKSRAPHAMVRGAWSSLVRHNGNIGIAELCAGLGVSRRHLANRFRHDIGQTPKTIARILRFTHTRTLAACMTRPDWALLAQDAGYSDQAHLIREFTEMAGMPPTSLAKASSLPA